MKTILFGLCVFLIGAVFTGCASAANPTEMSSGKMEAKGQAEGAYHRVTAAEAKQLLQDDPSIILIDVRTPQEYADKHIPGSRLIPNETIQRDPLADISKESNIMVYCRTGHRSKLAADKLIQMGYQQVYDIEGGITVWPYETEAGPAK